jgi:hypothetical protein
LTLTTEPSINHASTGTRPSRLVRNKREGTDLVIQLQQAPPTQIFGPRTPRRHQWLHIGEEGTDYAEHQVLARIRYPDTLNAEFGSGDMERVKKALRTIVLEHNNWVDPESEEDNPRVYPPAQGEGSDGFWAALAQEEILLILRAIGAERKKVLSGLLTTSDASASG